MPDHFGLCVHKEKPSWLGVDHPQKQKPQPSTRSAVKATPKLHQESRWLGLSWQRLPVQNPRRRNHFREKTHASCTPKKTASDFSQAATSKQIRATHTSTRRKKSLEQNSHTHFQGGNSRSSDTPLFLERSGQCSKERVQGNGGRPFR